MAKWDDEIPEVETPEPEADELRLRDVSDDDDYGPYTYAIWESGNDQTYILTTALVDLEESC